MNSNTYKDPDLVFHRADYWDSSFGDWPVYPYCVEEAVRDGSRSFYDTNCQYLSIIIITKGALLYRDKAGAEYLIEKGKILIIPRGSNYSYVTTSVNYYHRIVLEIKGLLLAQNEELLGLDTCRVAETNSPLLKKLLGYYFSIRDDLAEKTRESMASAIGTTTRVISLLAQNLRDQTPEEYLVSRAKAKLEQNLSSSYSIRKLAAELGICHSLLDRIFRKQTGIPPQQYRIAHRNSLAEHYLKHTSLSIKEVSVMLGYKSQLYFSGEFKNAFGMSPRKFRNTNM